MAVTSLFRSGPRRPTDPTGQGLPDRSEAALGLFPPDALRAGVRDGSAMVGCEVADDGSLANCSVVSEAPVGMGFGAAALQIVAVMKMNPWTTQGTPVEGARIQIPIHLVLPSEAAPSAPSAAPPAAATPPKP
jgi:TonB family protein